MYFQLAKLDTFLVIVQYIQVFAYMKCSVRMHIYFTYICKQRYFYVYICGAFRCRLNQGDFVEISMSYFIVLQKERQHTNRIRLYIIKYIRLQVLYDIDLIHVFCSIRNIQNKVNGINTRTHTRTHTFTPGCLLHICLCNLYA